MTDLPAQYRNTIRKNHLSAATVIARALRCRAATASPQQGAPSPPLDHAEVVRSQGRKKVQQRAQRPRKRRHEARQRRCHRYAAQLH